MDILWLLYTASSALFFLSCLISFFALLLYKPQSAIKNTEEMGVSVVICAKNELHNLKRNLPGFLKQHYQNFEVIVVDDKSTDGTYDYAYELSKHHPNLKIVRIDDTPDHINNKKYAITLGVRAAQNDLLVLSDADCWPNSDRWLAGMVAPFKRDGIQIVLGYSQYSKAKGLLNLFIRYETLMTALQYISLALLGRPYMGVGRNLAYTKSLFLSGRGFGRYQNTVGGDDDLFVQEHANRKNTAVQIGSGCLVYSNPKKDLKSFLIQKKRHLSVGKYYRWSDRMILGVLFLTKLIFWLSFISVILAGFKLNETIIGFLIVLFSYLATILLLKLKAGDLTSIWLTPLLDILYLFYYISTGLGVLFTKRIKWS